MSEDPLAHEVAALTRRYEQNAEQTADALKVLKSDVLHLRLEVGAVSTRVEALEGSVSELRVDVTSLREEVRAGNARIVELLSRLVGEAPE